jgi:Zn-dependent peptidase ImmA (M78 family)
LRSKLRNPDEEGNRIEREANAFASELLMPAKAVRREFTRLVGSDQLSVRSARAEHLFKFAEVRPEFAAARLAEAQLSSTSGSFADFFGVSKQAAARRILELELVR